jgi:hypothetical protein
MALSRITVSAEPPARAACRELLCSPTRSYVELTDGDAFA